MGTLEFRRWCRWFNSVPSAAIERIVGVAKIRLSARPYRSSLAGRRRLRLQVLDLEQEFWQDIRLRRRKLKPQSTATPDRQDAGRCSIPNRRTKRGIVSGFFAR